MVRLGMLARMRRVAEEQLGCCSPCPGSGQASRGTRHAGCSGRGRAGDRVVRAGVPTAPAALLQQGYWAAAPVCAPPRAPPSLGTLPVSPGAGLPRCLHWQRHQRAPTSALAASTRALASGSRVGDGGWPRGILCPHPTRPRRFTSAPRLHLQLQTRLHQAALLLDELVEGGVQGSFIVRAGLPAAGTRGR